MENIIAVVIGIAIGALAMYLFRPSKGDPNAPKAKPPGVIPSSEAKILNNEWTAKRKAANDKAAGKTDNRSAWWSVEELQNYIDYAQNQTGQMGYTMDGLRVYLGVYPGKAPDGKADYTTLFMVPTGKKTGPSSNTIIRTDPDAEASGTSSDIEHADALNLGSNGHPPGSGYPQ